MSIKDNELFTQLLSQFQIINFLRENRQDKKRGLGRREGFLNTMTVPIKKFVQSKEVTDMLQAILKKDGRRNESGETICS